MSKADLDWAVPYLFFSLAPRRIQSDDASIKRHIVVNGCGAFSKVELLMFLL